MPVVFLSYSKKDHFFADLVDIKLSEAGIALWRDQGLLRAGTDWRQGIEKGISDSLAVLVALSANSAESSYVTFEWAYALGKGKAVIPIRLNECLVHPKLETIQHLDFSVPGALPWASLIDRVREIETDVEPDEAAARADVTAPMPAPEDTNAKALLDYMNQRGFQMVSFDRLRQRIDPTLSDQEFNEIIARNPTVFRHARLAGGKNGIAKLIP
jgi:TIR domain